MHESSGFGGGVVTSRSPNPEKIPDPARANRVKILDTMLRKHPKFEGCPDWVKPLMFIEYQVTSEYFLRLSGSPVGSEHATQ
jgi:hypothetical protein